MMQQLVSFLLPNYNNEKYLSECLESIFNQSYKNWELIFVDDASTDSSIEILESYPQERIRLIKNESNLGITKCLNIGLKYCSGVFVARIDGDDYCHRDRLKKQVKYLNKNIDVALIGSARQIVGTDRIYNREIKKNQGNAKILFENFVAHPSAMIRKEVLDRFALCYDENFKYAQDYDLWLRVALHARVANLGKVLLFYREHDKQISREKIDEQTRFAHAARKRAFLRLGFQLNERDLQLIESLSAYPSELLEAEREEITNIVSTLTMSVSKSPYIDKRKWNMFLRRYTSYITFK